MCTKSALFSYRMLVNLHELRGTDDGFHIFETFQPIRGYRRFPFYGRGPVIDITLFHFDIILKNLL